MLLHSLYKAHQDDTSSVSKKAAYSNICRAAKSRLGDMQDTWLSKKTEEIQSITDRKDMKKFCDVRKIVYDPKRSGVTHCLVQMELLLTDKNKR